MAGYLSDDEVLGVLPRFSLDDALAAEGVTGQLADVARSIYQQESGSGRNTTTSNAGAVGGMQILPGTFRSVADDGWDIADPMHNARAGIRYIKHLSERADGDPLLTAVGYYGGPGAQQKARNGVAVSDPRNPKAPNTLQYAQQVVGRMPKGDAPEYLSDDDLLGIVQAPSAGGYLSDEDLLGIVQPTAAKASPDDISPEVAKLRKADELEKKAAGMSRSIGEMAADTGIAALQGAMGVAALPALAYEMLGGSKDNLLRRTLNQGMEAGDALKSDAMRAEQEAVAARMATADNWREALALGIRAGLNPTIAVDMAARMFPQMIAGGGAAALAGKAAAGVAGLAKAAPVAAAISGRGAGVAEAAASVVGKVATSPLTKLLPSATTAGAVGTSALIQGDSVGNDLYQDLMKAPAAAWEDGVEAFAPLRDALLEQAPQGLGDADKLDWANTQARQQLADDMSRSATGKAALISLAANALPGGSSIERMFAKGAAPAAVRQGMAGAAIKGMVGEGLVSEPLEEGGGEWVKSVALQALDPSIDPMKNAAGAAGQAMGVAGPMGAVGGMRGAMDSNAQLSMRERINAERERLQAMRVVKDRAGEFVAEKRQQAVADIGAQTSVDGAIAAANRAVNIDSDKLLAEALGSVGIDLAEIKAADAAQAAQAQAEQAMAEAAQKAAEQAAKAPPPTQETVPTASQVQAVAPAAAPMVNQNTQPGTQNEPARVWYGRRGDGYVTPEDAERGLKERTRIQSSLDWKVEQTPDGKYRLAGYAPVAAQAAAPAPAMAVAPTIVPESMPIAPTAMPQRPDGMVGGAIYHTPADSSIPAVPAVPAEIPGNAGNAPSAPVRLGRDQTPLAEGGQPFSTHAAAVEAKRLQPMMRVVQVKGGYALAEKTAAQLAAEEKAAQRLRQARTSPKGEPIPANAFIAAAGGMQAMTRSDMGVDGNPRIGNRTLFAAAGKGLSIERATEMLVAEGYLREGASHNDAYALIKRGLTQPQYNADGIERLAEMEAAAQFDDYLAAQEEAAQDVGEDFDPFAPGGGFGLPSDFTAAELAEVGYTDADPVLQAEVRALMAQAEAMGFDPADILEETVRTYANATQDQYNAAAKQTLAQAIARSSADGGSAVAQAPSARTSAETAQELTAPTRGDILASQERASNERSTQEHEQIRRESEAGSSLFELTREDGRQDTTGGLFDQRPQERTAAPQEQTQTENFKRWLKDSKVVDADGKPLAMYHGTSGNEGGDAFTWFNTYASNYGLMGQGAYFTDNPEVASSYTTKGKGDTPTVYKVFLSIQNPIDMDAKADPAKWQEKFDGIEDYHEGGDTNESWYRAAEDWMRDQGVSREEGAFAMQESLISMGFDGITHIGGGRVKSDGVRHRVYIAFDPEQIKSATGNNGNFAPTNPDIRFSFAGQQAATADTMALATAQQRLDAGENAEAVRQDTGWFKGADGKWRFEINDADAKYIGKEAMEKAAEDDPYKMAEMRLEEVLDHPALFAAYPGLRDVSVAYEASSAADGDLYYGANYNAEDNVITIGNGLDEGTQLSALLHEIQHGIQTAEGFATGGSMEARADVMDAVTQQRNLWAEVAAIRREMDKGLSDEQITSDWYEATDRAPMAEAMQIAKDPELDTETAIQNVDKLEAQLKRLRGESRSDTYTRLAGEVEARNTQARQTLTDAQRRATPPSQTADVADSDVIVMLNGKAAMSAPTPANAAPDAAPQPLRTPAATIRAAINRAYGKLLGQLEAKGLVTISQTEEDAINAAAQARADKTGGDVAAIKRSLTAAMQGGTDLDVKRSANGSLEGFFDPQTGQSFLVADGLTAEAAPGTLMHEVGIHMAADGKMAPLFERAARLLRMGKGNAFFDRVRQRMESAGETSPEEAAAYIVTEYENDRAKAPQTVLQWFKDMTAAVRAWLHAKGALIPASALTAADIAAVARANARSLAHGNAEPGGPKFSKAAGPSPVSKLVEGWTLLAGADGIFKSPKSDSHDLDEVFSIVAPGFDISPARQTDEMDSAWRISPVDQPEKYGYVMAYKDGRVELNVPRLKEGDGGSQAYVAVGNWAHNTGRKFAADRYGLSETGSARRLENLASMAIKFGSAKFMDMGENSLGVEWTNSDEQNISSLLSAAYDKVRSSIPEIDQYDYDFEKQQFVAKAENAGGVRVVADPAAELIDKARKAGLPAGRSTIHRAILTGTLIRGKDLPAAVREIGNQAVPESLSGLIYSRARKPSQNQAAGFSLPEETLWLKKRRQFQDYFLRVKMAQDAVLQQGGVLDEKTDTYRAEELSHGRTASLLEDFAKNQVEPLVKKALKRGVDMDELALFAYAMHAPERNAQIASIDAQLQDGGSGMTNAEAKAIIDQARQDGKLADLQDLHADLMGITTANRLVMLDEGLITQTEFDAINGAYQNYIPLRGFEVVDEDGKRTGLSAGKGFNVRGKETMRAKGRTSRAGLLIENAIADYQRTVVRAERNHVAKVFLNFAMKNPDPALWEIDALTTRKAIDRQTGRIARTTEVNKGEDTIAVKVNGVEIYIRIKDELLLRAMKKAHTDDTGETERVLMRSVGLYTSLLRNTLTRFNPEFAVVNALRDFGFGAVAALDELGAKGAAKFMYHYKSAIATSARNERNRLNPQSQDQHKADWDKWFTEYRAAGGTTSGFYAKGAEEVAKDIRQILLTAGAQPKDWKERLVANKPARAVKAVGRVLEFAGATSENAARVAAYRTAREMGKTPSQAASIAKNLTTNFDRKGELGQLTNSFYVFFNAAVQGSQRTLKMLGNKKVLGYMAGVTAASVSLALFSAIQGGDDPDDDMAYWDKIPAHVKERNFILMLPPGEQIEGAQQVGTKGRYIAIPVQYGLNVFHVIGYQIADVMRHQKDKTRGSSFAKAGIAVASAVAGSFNPLGGAVDLSNGSSVAQAVAPSLMDPVIQLATGTNAFGRDVAPFKSPFDTRPDSENANVRQEGGTYHRVAQWINAATGGDEYESGAIDLSPGTLENVVRAMTGGTGPFLYDVLNLSAKTVERAMGGDPDLFVRDVPFWRKVYGETAGDVDQGLFYERRKEIEEARGIQKRREEDGLEMTDTKKLYQASMASDASKFTRALSDLRKDMVAVKKDAEMSDVEKRTRLRELRAERDAITASFNKEWMEVMKEWAASDGTE